jgi:hypothetical protein
VDLKSVNWKRGLNTAFKVIMDSKSLMLIALMGFTVYGIGWDTVFRPNLETIKNRDTAIDEQKKMLAEKGEQQKQYGVWEQQLKSLDTRMIAVTQSDQPNLIALTIADELKKVANGEARDEAILPSLEPPHNRRSTIEFKLTAGPTSVDLLKPEGAAAEAQPVPASPVSGSPGKPGEGKPGEAGAGGGVPDTLPVDRFDYDLKVSGTYPALVDLLNELVIRKKLVKINKVVITKPATATPDDEPDAQDAPEHPVPLEMTISLSIFLYASTEQP